MVWAEVIFFLFEGIAEVFFFRSPTCPHCYVNLQQKSKRNNKRLYRCPGCEGQWLKSGKTWQALPRQVKSEVFRDEGI
jgi:tRNA(Ile2) C34 agmatinyltransferase TiaS